MGYKEYIFYNLVVQTLEHAAQRSGSTPSLETLKVIVDRILNNLIQLKCFMFIAEGLNYMIFKSFFQSKTFYGSMKFTTLVK